MGPLSERSRRILRGIASELSYERLIAGGLARSEGDIFSAAAEALELIDSDGPSDGPSGGPGAGGPPASASGGTGGGGGAYSVAEIRTEHARAYQPWSAEEDARLAGLVARGERAGAIAVILGRQPGAIRSRIERLNRA